MKLETERLYICRVHIQVANEQGYNSGPHIVGHVKNVKRCNFIMGAWGVLGDIGGNQTRIKQ